jgi:PAS domain S-box-containing protein
VTSIAVRLRGAAAALPRPPRRIRLLVAVTSLIGGLLLVVDGAHALQAVHRPPVLHLLAVVAVVLAGEIALLRIRVGHNGNSFTWAEASMILGVSIAGWDWYIALGGLTVLVRQLVLRRPVYKAAYNAAALTTGATLGRLACWAFTGKWAGVGHVLAWREALGLCAAAGVYFLWVSGAVSVAVAWAQGLPVVDVWRRGAQLRLVMYAGNSLAGLATVLVGDWNRPTIVVLPFFFLVLYLAYNNFLRAQQERDAWRDLHAATLNLQQMDTPDVVDAVRRGGDTLFGSERTEVVFATDPRVGTLAVPALLAAGLVADEPITLHRDTAAVALQKELAALDLHTVVVSPLESMGRRLGVLLLGFRGIVRMKPRELRVLATFADQTSISLQQAELFEELSTEQSRLSAIVQHASDGIMLLDVDGRICSWNPAMSRLTGRAESDVLGEPLEDALDAVCADGAPLEMRELIAQLARIDECRLAVTVTTADAQQREVVLALSAVRDRDGDCDFAVVVARDVTTQREVEQAKQDFIATVSHELRTPLTPLKGYLKLLVRPGFNPDEAKRTALLKMLLDQTGQLERLVEDLLSVSRMQHGEFSVRPEMADVVDVVGRAVRDLGTGTDRRVEVDLPDQPLVGVCDPVRLGQVVSNLLSNADKYSAPGPPIEVKVTSAGGDIEIVVRDHGPGVPVDARETVFEPFRRLGDPLTRDTRGTGLGLHIARQLVEAMQGRIWVGDAPGGGAAFHVVLPVGVPAHPAQPRETLAPATR